MNSYLRMNERGAVNGLLVATITLVFLFLGASAFAIWSYMNYDDQKTNVDAKVSVAVAEAKKEQADLDAEKFMQQEKEPNRQFVGPDDYGRLVFNYPKTWSAYIESDTSGRGDYAAYLNPVTVPPVSNTQQFALRVTIQNRDYDEVLDSYSGLVEEGALRSSSVSSNGKSGTRLDGNFSDDIRGSLVVFRVRDKTITLRTDAETFKPDFDALIKTIDFNA